MRNRRLIWAVWVFPIYLLATFAGDARATGNPIELGLGHAAVFVPFAALFSYPLLIAIQIGVARLVRRLAHSNRREFTPWEFLGVALWCVLILSSFLRTSDRSYYRRFVSDDVPSSLRSFEVRHGSGFGNSNWRVAFRIDPAEFPKVLARHEYKREPANTTLAAITALDEQLQLALPDEPLTEEHTYSNHTDGGGRVITIYTNATHDFVFVSGSSD